MKLKSIRSSYTRASRAHSEAKRSSASADIKKKKKIWRWYDRVDAFSDLILNQEWENPTWYS